MITAGKFILALFMLIGAVFAWYGAREMLGTKSLVKISTGTAKAKFSGYHREYYETTSTTEIPGGTMHTTNTLSVLSYPEFTYIAPDGSERVVRETKGHIFEFFTPGEEVDILLFPHFEPRLNGFFALYARDLVILIIGFGFFFVSFSFWKFALPLLLKSEHTMKELAKAEGYFERILNEQVGPVSIRTLLYGFGGFMAFMLLIALGAGLTPFFPELRFGSGGRLLAALEEKRFDDAKALLARKANVNSANKYDQTPLLLALESGRADLGRMLIDAGADVNGKSKMYMTPIRVATQSGDLDMVRLLLAKGASPDAPEDETPPFVYALVAKRYDIARALIEAGADVKRVYQDGNNSYTLGDMAVLAKRDDLVDLIRSRGGNFLKITGR